MLPEPAAGNRDGAQAASTPRLRSLLLTDLCDSVALVEKLGDTAAAELFRQHDRLVLRLQQQWQGRLIDRSDGLLLLFERPVNALAFAMDYLRGLHELERGRGVVLRARAGLHVGEVLTWHNSPEAVSVGAKPLEVEGLAKLMAARLMALARPGQILLSAVAETLARRAAGELGERGGQLLWKSHGRWRFKGVPTAQEVFEAGEPGFAPLRMPRSSPKAWRDLPLWRRPVALVVEALLLLGLVVGLWFITRPEPAIAFAERDWVVMGDLRNLTGNTLLDDSVAQAFRISLEQSRYVNIVSDMTVSDTLTRMRRGRDTRIDRMIGSEVAIRDGARAVVLPTLAEIGGKLRMTVEIVDPQTRSTVHLLSRDVAHADGLLTSIDSLAGSLRDRLGESPQAIRRISQPLPEVTTGSLDALKLYALGVKAYNGRRMDDARALFLKAVEIDPEFALALVGIMRTYMTQGKAGEAEVYLRRAAILREHLSVRDRLYMEAWEAEFEPHPSLSAPAKWRLLAEVYPDIAGAQQNYAWAEYVKGNLDEALVAATAAASSKDALRYISRELIGRIHLAREEYDAAIRNFTESEKIAGAPPNRRHASALAAMGKLPDALGVLESCATREPSNALVHVEWTAALLAAGQAGKALQIAEQGVAKAASDNDVMRVPLQLGAMVARYGAGERMPSRTLDDMLAHAFQAAEAAGAGDADDLVAIALAASRVKQRFAGLPLNASDERRLAKLVQHSRHPRSEALLAVVVADQWRLRGEPARSAEQLRAAAKEGNSVQWHVAMRDALHAMGDHEGSQQQQRWLSGHRGMAYGDPLGAQAFVVMNVVDTIATDAAIAGDSVVEAKDHGVRGLGGHALH